MHVDTADVERRVLEVQLHGNLEKALAVALVLCGTGDVAEDWKVRQRRLAGDDHVADDFTRRRYLPRGFDDDVRLLNVRLVTQIQAHERFQRGSLALVHEALAELAELGRGEPDAGVGAPGGERENRRRLDLVHDVHGTARSAVDPQFA